MARLKDKYLALKPELQSSLGIANVMQVPALEKVIISVGCGLLKVRFRLFIISTFIGSIIRDFIYIYLGYKITKLFKN